MNGAEGGGENTPSWSGGGVWVRIIFRRWLLVLSLKGGVGFLYREVAENESVREQKNE